MSGGFWAHVQALSDPVQRRWLWGRLRNRWTAVADAPPPAYRGAVPAEESPGSVDFPTLSPAAPQGPILLALPGGETARLAADKVDALIDRRWSDVAAWQAFHGFAWTIQDAGQDAGGAALGLLLPAWLERHGTPDSSAVWHADVVAERALALMDMAERAGLPEPKAGAVRALGAHAGVLLKSFAAEPASSSALARRAHALVRLGLGLAMPATARFGFAALAAETGRLLMPSGISRMESTHYHLRLCQSLADSWLAGGRHHRAEAAEIERLLRRAIAVLPLLHLPGGLPLIGDVMESQPADWLAGLLRGAPLDRGWTGQLPAEDRTRFGRLRDDCLMPDLEALRADGWLRVDHAGWSGLWHAVPGGWPAFDGHGHQDLGSCELHFGTVPVFVDPGGGPLASNNGQCLYRRAAAHGGLQLDRRDPYPLDHPDYSDAFRREAAGNPPCLRAEFDGASLTFGSLAGIGGLREGCRQWHFSAEGVVIDDMLNGTGRYPASRRLITPLAARQETATTLLLEGSGLRLRVTADQPLRITTIDGRRGFGAAEPLRAIEIGGRINLPWRGRICVLPY